MDQIDVAVADPDKHSAIFGNLLGLEVHGFEEVGPYEGLRSAFARIGEVDFEFSEDRALELYREGDRSTGYFAMDCQTR